MKTFLRWGALVFLALALLAAGGYVVHGISGATKVAQAKKRAASDLAAALPASSQQAVHDRERVRAAVGARWGRPAYSWQELVCNLESVDAGWIVQYYTQECRLHSVDLVPVASARGDRCEWAPMPPIPALRPGDGPLYGAAARVGPSNAFDDTYPYRLGCAGGILGPSTYGASRLLSGGRPTSLAESPAWVVVTVDTDVSTTRLGCDPWAIVFCSEPVDKPVLGKLE